MDFELSHEVGALHDSVRRLAVDKIKPRAREVDSTGEYPQDFFDAFRDAGLLGCASPRRTAARRRDPGAHDRDRGGHQVLERRGADAPAHPAAHRAGDDRRHRGAEAPLPARHRRRPGECAFGLSEPQAGSDVVGMRTKADARSRREGGWILNGTKCWMSGVRQADWYTVFAKTGDPRRAHARSPPSSWTGTRAGVDPGGPTRRWACAASTRASWCSTTSGAGENVIGEVGGFRLAMLGLNSMRPIVAARGIGLAEGALMYATQYVQPARGLRHHHLRSRASSGRSPSPRSTSRRHACSPTAPPWLADQGKFTREYVPYLSMAKYHATELAVRASGLAVQLLGAAGYMEDHPTEQWYRDAKQLTIVEGTSQVQLGLVARGVLDHDLWWD